jgi:hypothetical protein
MGCLNCKSKKNKTTDSRGNKLKKYAFLKPEQLELLRQQEALEEEKKNKPADEK